MGAVGLRIEGQGGEETYEGSERDVCVCERERERELSEIHLVLLPVRVGLRRMSMSKEVKWRRAKHV